MQSQVGLEVALPLSGAGSSDGIVAGLPLQPSRNASATACSRPGKLDPRETAACGIQFELATP